MVKNSRRCSRSTTHSHYSLSRSFLPVKLPGKRAGPRVRRCAWRIPPIPAASPRAQRGAAALAAGTLRPARKPPAADREPDQRSVRPAADVGVVGAGPRHLLLGGHPGRAPRSRAAAGAANSNASAAAAASRRAVRLARTDATAAGSRSRHRRRRPRELAARGVGHAERAGQFLPGAGLPLAGVAERQCPATAPTPPGGPAGRPGTGRKVPVAAPPSSAGRCVTTSPGNGRTSRRLI